jgi:hypothetical protein
MWVVIMEEAHLHPKQAFHFGSAEDAYLNRLKIEH